MWTYVHICVYVNIYIIPRTCDYVNFHNNSIFSMNGSYDSLKLENVHKSGPSDTEK